MINRECHEVQLNMCAYGARKRDVYACMSCKIDGTQTDAYVYYACFAYRVIAKVEF
jgi:hypothetical protein